MTREAKASDRGSASRGDVVRWLPLPDGDRALAEALSAGRPGAFAHFFDRYGDGVRRLLIRVLGPDQDIPELVHDVFLSALDSIPQLKNPEALRPWLMRIAVFHARALIRKRTRRRFFGQLAVGEAANSDVAPAFNPETSEALRATYAVLLRMPAKQRIAFALRFIEQLELSEVATACDVSLATCKRHLRLAERNFLKRARQNPVLEPWVAEGRWSQK